jgi:hypothetical protein
MLVRRSRVSGLARIDSSLCLFVVILYFIFWNIDLSVVFGAKIDAAILPPGRWVCILLVGGIFALSLVINFQATRHYGQALLLFCALLIPSVVFSSDPISSIIEFSRTVSIFMLFCVVAVRPHLFQRLTHAIGIFSVSFVVFSLPYIDYGSVVHTVEAARNLDTLRERSAGIATNVNTLGFGAAVATAYGLFGLRRSVANISATMVICSVAMACLLASGSRTSLILAAVLYLFFLLRFFRKPRLIELWIARLNKSVLFLMYLFILGIPIGYVIWFAHLSEAPMNSFAASDAARVALWENAIKGFLANPVIGMGFGLNIAETFNPVLRGYNMAPYAHNALLNIVCGAGMLGLLLLLWIVHQAVRIPIRVVAAFVTGPGRRTVPDLVWFAIMVDIIVLLSAVVEGALQNSYGVNAYFAVCLGGLFAILRVLSNRGRLRSDKSVRRAGTLVLQSQAGRWQ